MSDQGRLDRQLRIPEWNQGILERAQVGVVGDEGLLTSLYLLGTAALGINQVRVVAPKLDERLISMARRLNPDWRLSHFEGYLTHPCCQEVLGNGNLAVVLSSYGLADKIILENAFQRRLMVIRCLSRQDEREEGFTIFTYVRGREWPELQEVMSGRSLPGNAAVRDGAMDIIAAGIILEETKNLLFGGKKSPEVLRYQRPRFPPVHQQPSLAIVGAGALGNFVGLGLALAGFKKMTFIDPDVIEVTNLNRQVFFSGAVGAGKAETLAARLNTWFETRAAGVRDYFREGSDISGFDVIFDCVDNFDSRIALSEACAAAGKILISGGSDVAARPGSGLSPPEAASDSGCFTGFAGDCGPASSERPRPGTGSLHLPTGSGGDHDQSDYRRLYGGGIPKSLSRSGSGTFVLRRHRGAKICPGAVEAD